jgi:hypothetical protein
VLLRIGGMDVIVPNHLDTCRRKPVNSPKPM